MKTLLWLDDIRNPFDKDFTPYVALYNPFLNQPHEIAWVKNYQEFAEYLKWYGLPDAVSFDHDLAPEHYTPEEYWGNYSASKDYQESQNYVEPTGYDCAKLLVSYCQSTGNKIPLCVYHTANPVGKVNMKAYIENAKKHLNL